jgi:hypothetical protein
MQEAKFSFNTKFRLWGVECQFTIRDDEGTAGQIFLKGTQLVAVMLKSGAQPSNGNGHASAGPVPPVSPRVAAVEPLFQEEPVKPVCVKCQSQNLELVSFQRDGKPRQAWKCQACGKWQPEKK